jgi:tRNA (guanine9-N1)-methyltransferase
MDSLDTNPVVEQTAEPEKPAKSKKAMKKEKKKEKWEATKIQVRKEMKVFFEMQIVRH